jgi:hypothetical protein
MFITRRKNQEKTFIQIQYVYKELKMKNILLIETEIILNGSSRNHMEHL